MAMPQKQSYVVKVVNEHEVESLTRSGWRIREILPWQHVEPFSETASPLVNGFPQTTYATKGFLVSTNKFVMEHNADSALAEMSEKLAKLEAEHAALQSAYANAGKDLFAAQETVRGLNNRIGYLTNDLDGARVDFQKERERNRKMENDIAKIRQAVGELKMKEILAS